MTEVKGLPSEGEGHDSQHPRTSRKDSTAKDHPKDHTKDSSHFGKEPPPEKHLSREYSAARVRQQNIDIQVFAYSKGKELNELARLFDPKSEDICIGKNHRAAGMIAYIPGTTIVLLGMFLKKKSRRPERSEDSRRPEHSESRRPERGEVTKISGPPEKSDERKTEPHVAGGESRKRDEVTRVIAPPERSEETRRGSPSSESEHEPVLEVGIPGGRAQGEEYPIQNMVREFFEETCGFFPKEKLEELLDFPQRYHSSVIKEAKYTVFYVSTEHIYSGDPREIPQLYEKMEKVPQNSKIDYASSLLLVDLKNLPANTSSFARQVLGNKAVRNFFGT